MFDVAVDGKTVFSKHKTNRFPTMDDLGGALG